MFRVYLGILSLVLLAVGPGCSAVSRNDEGQEMEEFYPDFPEMTSEAEEQEAISAVLGDMQSALEAGDPQAMGAFFIPEVREAQLARLRENQHMMAALAAPLEGAVMSALSTEYGWQEERYRTAEVEVVVNGTTLHITMAKSGGQWLVAVF